MHIHDEKHKSCPVAESSVVTSGLSTKELIMHLSGLTRLSYQADVLGNGLIRL